MLLPLALTMHNLAQASEFAYDVAPLLSCVTSIAVSQGRLLPTELAKYNPAGTTNDLEFPGISEVMDGWHWVQRMVRLGSSTLKQKCRSLDDGGGTASPACGGVVWWKSGGSQELPGGSWVAVKSCLVEVGWQ
jgi:hypothetical protein